MALSDGPQGIDVEGKRRHLAGAVSAHQFAAFLDKPQCILEGQRSGGHQRRVFAEAVSAHQSGLQAVFGGFPKHLQAGDGVREQGGLRESRQVERVLRSLEAQCGEVVTQHLAGMFVDLADSRVFLEQVPPHTDVLRTLSREYE